MCKHQVFKIELPRSIEYLNFFYHNNWIDNYMIVTIYIVITQKIEV
jgi:hypothetical protein